MHHTDKNKMIKKEIIYESNTNFLKGNLRNTHFTVSYSINPPCLKFAQGDARNDDQPCSIDTLWDLW